MDNPKVMLGVVHKKTNEQSLLSDHSYTKSLLTSSPVREYISIVLIYSASSIFIMAALGNKYNEQSLGGWASFWFYSHLPGKPKGKSLCLYL